MITVRSTFFGQVCRSIVALCCTGAIVLPLIPHPDRDSARKAGRISQSVLLYLQDSDQVFPPGTKGTVWNSREIGWTYAIQPYLKSFRPLLVRKDPADSRAWPSWLRSQKGAIHVSFVSNGYMKQDKVSWGLYGVMGVDQSMGYGWMTRGRTSMTEIAHPSTTIMAAEAFNGQPIFFTGAIVTGVNWWDKLTGFGGLIPDPTRDGKPYLVNGFAQTTDNRNGALNYQINGKSLFIWCDGHVSMLPPLATNAHPAVRSSNLWDALRP